VSLSGGLTKNHPELERTPWKSYGCVPTSGPEQADCNSSQDKTRLYAYGAFEIDNIIEKEKPDIYIGVQDFWGVNYSINKPWFNKITSAIWTTLDSLPLLVNAVDDAPKIKNYWVWSNFAEKEMHRLGHSHVKTLHGAIDVSDFKMLDKSEKAKIRKAHEIPDDHFIIGFVFRNQLRKSVPNLLQGYKIFKKNNPTVKARLLFHTNWQEGWNIPKLCAEHQIEVKEIYTTYICKNCKDFFVKPFSGAEIDCPTCQKKKQLITTGTSFGITEAQLNHVYNLMDVYCHPFTSGGQEIPIQEAKLTGLITLVTNYSCGEEMCCPEAHSLPLEWTEYREFGTEFIKASTNPNSIAEKLQEFLAMPEETKIKLGKLARKWVIDNFSVSRIAGEIEEFIDKSPLAFYEEKQEQKVDKNPYASVPYIADDRLWLKCLYMEILKMNVSDDDEGLDHWVKKLSEGAGRDAVESYFRDVALKEYEKNKSYKVEDLLSGAKPEDRILVSINSSLENIFLSTKIISAIKEKYPDKKIFVCSNESCNSVFSGNDLIECVFIASREFNDPEFLKKNFFETFSLDNFSINNHHSILIR